MWSIRRPEQLQSSAYSRRETSFIDRDFQLRYTKKTFWISTFATLLFFLPALYWCNQNYEIFIELAYSSNAQLVKHLESEQATLNTLLAAALLGQTAFLWIMGNRMTAKVIAPLKIMRNHLRLLSRGELSVTPVRLRSEDEFQDLFTTYNYFYSTLRAQAYKDLERFEGMRAHTTHPIVLETLKSLINEKKIQLNEHKPIVVAPSFSPNASGPSPGSRRVS
jgi:methyl-accepting chemotaxis protein